MTSICETAPAKINLTLKVGRRATDGYHPMQSLVVFANIGDELSFESAPDLSLKIDGPFGSGLDAGPDNLVLRAANALIAATGCQKGAAITLHKTLPVASGIGGGSADAAAALRGLNRLWDSGFSYVDLEKMGQALGADVPVCVQSRPRFMSGTGEILHDTGSWPILHGVLINPGFTLSTAQVFARFDEMNLGQVLSGHTYFVANNAHDALTELKTHSNCLTRAATALEPRLGELLETLEQCPQAQLVRLCGSGATCLALTDDQESAVDFEQELRMKYPKHWVQSVKLGGAE
ncbi:MAG: 4-(cytidine 5'-diphospho)-2-C-methyl-D-erythritol kinase [Robiginitomaculum sp.]|nr:MAG: 4-(cytidine 5'-diphospho)-2-C-methyl-D-erythritol kinase [Robiginitomaculum sp.]